MVDPRQRLLQSSHHLQHVGPGLTDRVGRDDLLALVEDFGAGFPVVQLRTPDVTQVDRNVVAHGHDDVLDVLRRFVLAHRAHDVAPLALVEVAAAEVAVLAVQGRGDLVHRDLT